MRHFYDKNVRFTVTKPVSNIFLRNKLNVEYLHAINCDKFNVDICGFAYMNKLENLSTKRQQLCQYMMPICYYIHTYSFIDLMSWASDTITGVNALAHETFHACNL